MPDKSVNSVEWMCTEVWIQAKESRYKSIRGKGIHFTHVMRQQKIVMERMNKMEILTPSKQSTRFVPKNVRNESKLKTQTLCTVTAVSRMPFQDGWPFLMGIYPEMTS